MGLPLAAWRRAGRGEGVQSTQFADAQLEHLVLARQVLGFGLVEGGFVARGRGGGGWGGQRIEVMLLVVVVVIVGTGSGVVLVADHGEQAIDLALLLVLKCLVELTQARGALVTRAGERVQLACRGQRGVVEREWQPDAGAPARVLGGAPDAGAARRRPLRVVAVHAGVQHGGGGQ